jgi:Carboxypeptidase regulatory-like domain/TonB dependent receptor-like, beta-barrel
MRIHHFIVAALALAGCLFAQVTSRLTGSVTDPSGAVVPGAMVEVYLPGGEKPVVSMPATSDGLFSFTGVAQGTYDVIVSAPGFRKHTDRSVVLTAGQETSIPPIRLEVGNVTETVEVSASATLVQTTNAEVGVNFSRTQIKDLPMLNRSPQSLVTALPGVANGRAGDSVVNGQRTSFTNVTLDGINIQDNYIRSNAVDFSPNLLLADQVEEMTIATSNSNPAFGNGASQIMFVTPSGTNSFHGGLFEHNRNSKFGANTWFNNQSGVKRPFLNVNQLGGKLGGPIKKDKLFFYFNYEAFRQHQQSAATRTILTADAANGIFTYPVGGVLQKVNLFQVTGLTADPTIAGLIKQIPTPDKINTTSQGDSTSLTALRNTGGYAFNIRNNRIRNNVTGKGDYVMSSKNNLTVTYAYNTDLLDRPDVATNFALIPNVNNDDKVSLVSGAWRWVPKPTLTNEVRFGFNRAPALFLTNEDFGSNLFGGLIFSNPVNVFRAQGRYTNTYNFADNASYSRGKHTIQFGYQLQRDYTEPYNDAGITPSYTLGISSLNTNGLGTAQLPGASSNDVTAANNLLANLVGYVSAYTQTYNVKDRTSGFVSGATNDRHWMVDDHSAYVQDNWKALPRVTLNLGVRYEYYTPVKEQNGLVLLPTLINNNPIDTLRSNATLDFASGSGRPLYKPDRNNFAPNIGLAWDITGDGKTALRAGYSMNYVNDEYLVAITGNANTNAGLSQTVTNPTALTNLVRAGLPAITNPSFKVPRTFLDNYNLSPTSNFGMADPNLRSPYVQQWNIGIERDIKGVILDVRYVGNHGTKLLRALDYNQIDINAGGFLADFRRAQSNGFLAQAASGVFDPAYNANIPGSQVLTVFPTLPNGGSLTNATNRTTIQQGSVADLAYTYQSTKVNGPINFFPNPYAASLRMMTNYSNSSYNGLQIDVRTREKRGLTMFGNYTYSKVLSDAVSGVDNNNQGRYEPMIDNNNRALERSRAPFDLTHIMKFNFVYRLPMGDGHRFNWKPINRFVLSGWVISGVFNRQSGENFSVYSGRGTFNRQNIFQSNQGNTMNSALTMAQLRDVFQFRMTGNGPFFVSPSAIGSDGRAVAPDGSAPFAGQVFTMPAAGTIGTMDRRIFDGPWDTTFDFGASKAIRITERNSIQLRMDARNFLNHPAFVVNDQTATSTTFGKITGTFSGARVFQFGLYYNF